MTHRTTTVNKQYAQTQAAYVSKQNSQKPTVTTTQQQVTDETDGASSLSQFHLLSCLRKDATSDSLASLQV